MIGFQSKESLAYLGVLFFSSIFFVLSCSKEKPELEPERLNIKSSQANPGYVKALNDFDFVGELHNEALDFVFQKLVNLKAEKNQQLSQVNLDFFVFGANACKSFVKESNKFPDVRATLKLIDLEIDRFIDYLGNPLAQISANNCYFEHTLTSFSNYFTPQQSSILSSIRDIINDDEKDVAVILKDLNDLNDVVKNTIADNEEALVVYSAISVGIHSLQYWNDNLEKWIGLFYDEMPNKFRRGFWRYIRRIATYDVGGGVGAAATVFVVNLFPGAGQVAYGGAIAGGAAGASVLTAVVDLINLL